MRLLGHLHTASLLQSCSSTKLFAVPPAPLASLSSTFTLYDSYVLDLWGVIHDGHTLYSSPTSSTSTLDTLTLLKRHNKNVHLLSNSSRRKQNVQHDLHTKFSIPPTLYTNLVTSGEVGHVSLSARPPQSLLCIGNGIDDIAYVSDSNWSFSNIESANLILARGTFSINGELTDPASPPLSSLRITQLLNEAAKRKIPMLCTNPDKIRPGKRRDIMPGAIASEYESMGGKVEYIGKPHNTPPSVYDSALLPPPKFGTCRVCKTCYNVNANDDNACRHHPGVIRGESRRKSDWEGEVGARGGGDGDLLFAWDCCGGEERAEGCVTGFHQSYDNTSTSAPPALDLTRVCMVGDSLATDVTGAFNAGFGGVVWVTDDGVHANEGESERANQLATLVESGGVNTRVHTISHFYNTPE